VAIRNSYGGYIGLLRYKLGYPNGKHRSEQRLIRPRSSSACVGKILDQQRQVDGEPTNSECRTRTRTNTNPNGTEANAAGRSVRACVARESKREGS
jgi:hypothetical protein